MKKIKTLFSVEDAVYRPGNVDEVRDLVLKSKQYLDNFLFYFVHAIDELTIN